MRNATPHDRSITLACIILLAGCGGGSTPIDGGSRSDSGARLDSGSTPDSGTARDAGGSDAGAQVDAGSDAGPPPPCSVDWSSSTTGGSFAPPALAGAPLQAWWYGSDFELHSADVGATGLTDRTLGTVDIALAVGFPVAVAPSGSDVVASAALPAVGAVVLASDGSIAHAAHALSGSEMATRGPYFAATPSGVVALWDAATTSGDVTRLALLDASGDVVGTPATIAPHFVRQIAWDGTGVLAADHDGEIGTLTRFATDGTVLASLAIPGAFSIDGIAFAQRADGSILVVGTTVGTLVLSVASADLSSATTWTIARRLDGGTVFLALASDGTRELLVWSDTRFSTSVAQISVALVNGTTLDAPTIVGPAQHVASQYGSELTAAHDATGWAIGWRTVSPDSGHVAHVTCTP